jgi:hypothetical protein
VRAASPLSGPKVGSPRSSGGSGSAVPAELGGDLTSRCGRLPTSKTKPSRDPYQRAGGQPNCWGSCLRRLQSARRHGCPTRCPRPITKYCRAVRRAPQSFGFLWPTGCSARLYRSQPSMVTKRRHDHLGTAHRALSEARAGGKRSFALRLKQEGAHQSRPVVTSSPPSAQALRAEPPSAST